MTIVTIALCLFLLYLLVERIALERRRAAIPLRISVTGTRGKSSVTRMIASILREDGRKVLAKTTGSQARYIFPDGTETDVPRRGLPTIIEQKKLFRVAATIDAECIVAEVMSISAENHFVESHQLLKPGWVVVTNVRQDHTDAMGATRTQIASVFCLDIPPQAKVIIHSQEDDAPFQAGVARAQGELIHAQPDLTSPLYQRHSGLRREFSQNVDLVVTLAEHLHIPEETIVRGILAAKHDIGESTIWMYRSEETGKTLYLLNGFAANDPESTFQVIEKAKDTLPQSAQKYIGVLSLRGDRGDRTLQWINVLKSSGSRYFDKLYVIGAHATIVRRKVQDVTVLKATAPREIMKTVAADAGDDAVIVGCGNIKGIGTSMIEYWQATGDRYGV